MTGYERDVSLDRLLVQEHIPSFSLKGSIPCNLVAPRLSLSTLWVQIRSLWKDLATLAVCFRTSPGLSVKCCCSSFFLSNPRHSLSQVFSICIALGSEDGRCSRKHRIWTVRRCIVGRLLRRFAFLQVSLATVPCSVVRNIRVRENFTSDRRSVDLRYTI